MAGIKVVSLNVNGLNIPHKRRILFDHLRKTKADLFLIQETHSTPDSAKRWELEWGSKAFFCHGTKSSRGVAILVSRTLPFQLIKRISDEDGRLLCLDLEIEEVVYTLASVYAPTQDKAKEQIGFVETIEETLMQLQATNIILGGDYNSSMNPLLDKNTPTTSTSSLAEQVRLKLSTLLSEWGLCDVWRMRNPNEPGFTFRRGTFASRLDYFMMSTHLSDSVASMNTKVLAHSDHAMLIMSLNKNTAT